MIRRGPSSRQPVGPPATTAEAAAFVRDYVVKLYDRQDGKGVDWTQIAGTLFLEAFDALENMPQGKRFCQGSCQRVWAT